MILYPALTPYQQRYADLPMRPLAVTLRLKPGSHLAGYDPLNLDNLLARCVVDEATQYRGLPSAPGAYALPAPLKCLWRSAEGYPLWAATPFFPIGHVEPDVAFWHKRAQTGTWTGTKSGNFSIRATQGRWMERRVPMPTQLCREWVAYCIGNTEEIARLLEPLRFVGKRRRNGFGEIELWRIEPVSEFDVLRDGRLLRNMPAFGLAALAPGYLPPETPYPVGWTPPQWKAALHHPGWYAGTPAERVVT